MKFSSINGLESISKILNGISKSIYLVNEFKPIYNDLKPVLLRGQSFFKSKSYDSTFLNKNYVDRYYQAPSNNLPKFFQ